MTELHARVDLVEGELKAPLAGVPRGLSKRAFAVVRLTRSDGTTGLGEASPLPGYSPDSIDDVARELGALTERPIQVDPLASPASLLADAFAASRLGCPSSRFALETALLDWLAKTRRYPVHQLIAGAADRSAIPIADLVTESRPAAWPAEVGALREEGASHVKLKIGAALDDEIAALRAIRRAHPELRIRLDGNQRLSPTDLRRHAGPLEALELELVEEPVLPERWLDVIDLPLPFALDETLRDRALAEQLLATGRVRAVVLKPTVLGGFRASLEVAERAAAYGVQALVSHTFDGPIARAAAAELALALQTELAAGLGVHPALALWPTHRTAAIEGRQIVAHRALGLGLRFDEDLDE